MAHTTPRRSRRRALVATAGLCLPLAPVVLTAAPAQSAEVTPVVHSADDARLALAPLGTYSSGVFDESAAEIVAFHAATDRTFVVNAQTGRIDVLDAADPTAPALVTSIEASSAPGVPTGAIANSVAVRADGLLVAAIEAPTKTDDGWLVFADAATLETLGAVTVGALPDMVALTPDGSVAVVANEGEPADDFSLDPEGSVSVVALPDQVAAPDASAVRTADFHAWEDDGARTLPDGVRVFGPTVNTERPVSANLEPEYVAIAPDGDAAYVVLQEANAVAVVDLATAEVTDIWALGTKDHSLAGQGLDPSDRDDTIAIAPQPLRGLFMPDGMEAYESGGTTYLVTANEGDAREWGDYLEPARVKSLGKGGLPPVCEDSPAADLLGDAALGRLNVSTASGLRSDGSCYEQLHSFGARSLSIWTTDGEQVFDTGDELERITAEANPAYFNSNHSEPNLEGRSDDKGPEPEGVTLGQVEGRTYAFLGLERVGGVMVYDVTEPAESRFVTYVNNRDFSVSVEDAEDPAAALEAVGDLGPEGLTFVDAEDSPTGEPLLVVGNEVSGTTTFFGVSSLTDAAPAATEVSVGGLPGASRYGVPRTPRVRVTADAGVPQGEVRVRAAGRELARAEFVDGVARPALPRRLDVGRYRLSFRFVPADPESFAPASVVRPLRVLKARTTTRARWQVRPTADRGGVVRARVRPRDGSVRIDAGRVAVRIGDRVRSAPVRAGVARVRVGRIAPGRTQVRVRYLGSATARRSVAPVRSVRVR